MQQRFTDFNQDSYTRDFEASLFPGMILTEGVKERRTPHNRHQEEAFSGHHTQLLRTSDHADDELQKYLKMEM